MKKTVLLLVLLLAASCRQREDVAETRGPRRTAAPAVTVTGTDVGFVLPEYSALWLDGTKFDMESRRGKVVLINLWATWCPPCREEIPELQALHDRYSKQGFEVIGVSLDESGVDAVKQFVAEKKMTYPVALDPEGGKLADILQASMLPTSVVLDRDGKIVWKRVGQIMPHDPELTKAIEAAL